MFSKLVLENFKSFNHFELDLMETESLKKVKKLAMIYGENSIGKTSIVDAFTLLSVSFRGLRSISIINNLARERTPKEDFDRFLNDFKINRLIKELRQIGNDNLMVVRFEGFSFSNKTKFIYEMKFDSTYIVYEKLLINNNLVFKIDKKNRETIISREHIKNEIVYLNIVETTKAYFGNYTFLSCIDFIAIKNVNTAAWRTSFSPELIDFMSMMESMMVRASDDFYMPIGDQKTFFTINMIEGEIYSTEDKKRLNKTEQALSMYFSSLYSNIKGVKYKLGNGVNGGQSYSLNFIEKNGTGTVTIPYYMASTGTKKMVELFVYLYEACIHNKVVIIDEIDTGINDLLLKHVFNGIEKLEGQLIFTTHNTLLLKSSLKKNIYLLDRDDEFNVFAYSLDEFGRKIQEKTDVIGQYINGLYGGVPQCGSFSMELISEAIKNNG